MNTYESRRKQRKNSARERQEARRKRQGGMATLASDVPTRSSDEGSTALWRERILLILRDVLWYITHKPQILSGVAIFAAVLFVLFVVSHLFTGRIFPNIWVLGVYMGDMTVEDASAALAEAWDKNVRIALYAGGDRVISAAPIDLGIQIDTKQAAEAARGVGLSGLPFGYNVIPNITVDYVTAQNYLLNLWDSVNIQPYNAGYEWRDGDLVGVPGREGRALDIVLTLERLIQDSVRVATTQRLDLVMSPVPPDSSNPQPFLEEARLLVSQPIQLRGYDPFKDEQIVWTTTAEEFTRWLEASRTGLTLRRGVFQSYLNALDATLNSAANTTVRYLDAEETMTQIERAITRRQPSVDLRIRYRQSTYTVQSGDSGFRISRKTGIPFFLIRESNPSVDWNRLSIGQTINLPSRDLILPEMPVPNKRIVVDLDRLLLVAYENGQQVFSWRVSSGRTEAPTSPGIYQILNHDEVAVGSGVELCGDNGCGQWEMYWFMGIYRVEGGVINGFHGAVRLPNGALLNNGNVGGRDTYGCIMSYNEDAKNLYDWAEKGTVVEIISSEFKPESSLGQQVLNASI